VRRREWLILAKACLDSTVACLAKHPEHYPASARRTYLFSCHRCRYPAPSPLVLVLADETTLGCGSLDRPDNHRDDFRLFWFGLGIGIPVQVEFEGGPETFIPRMSVCCFASDILYSFEYMEWNGIEGRMEGRKRSNDECQVHGPGSTTRTNRILRQHVWTNR
jgi:hypothetical protein